MIWPVPGRPGALRVALGVRQQLQRVGAALAAHVARVLLLPRARAVVPLVAAQLHCV